MKIAVLSGKGGAGKTFVAVNLAAVLPGCTYIDCDVEEPNGKIFFKPEIDKIHDAVSMIPEFSGERCTGCRKCVEFCAFNALFYIKEKPKVLAEVCHSCGGCQLVCPEGAITEKKRAVGTVEEGYGGNVRVVTGILNIGEASGIPVIEKALEVGTIQAADAVQVIDCPPGSACSVMAAISDADYCILVAEPTAFGLHNLEMVYDLTQIMKKRCGLVVNKGEKPYVPLQEFSRKNQIDILLKIPFSREIAALTSAGNIAVETDVFLKEQFMEMYQKIRRCVEP